MRPFLSMTAAAVLACSRMTFAEPAAPETSNGTAAAQTDAPKAAEAPKAEATATDGGVTITQPAVPLQPAVPDAPGTAAAMEKCSFIGISTSSIHPTAREQLDLPKGVGLIVDFIEPGSPAEKAGVQAHDIVQKLDDQLIINPQQLTVLVRLHKAGDEIALTVLRKGKNETLKVTLGEKMLPPIDDAEPMTLVVPGPAAAGQLQVMPALPGNGQGHQFRIAPVPMPPDLLKRLRQAGAGQHSATMTTADGTNTVTLNVKNGKKTAVIKDKDNNTLFDGPIDTDEERAKIPADVKEKLEKVEDNAREMGVLPPVEEKPLPGAEPQ